MEAIAVGVRRVERSDAALVVLFDLASADLVGRWVEAERQCCASIRWDIERTPAAVRLRICATPEQLDVLQQMFGYSASS
jgi:hypothetical protein